MIFFQFHLNCKLLFFDKPSILIQISAELLKNVHKYIEFKDLHLIFKKQLTCVYWILLLHCATTLLGVLCNNLGACPTRVVVRKRVSSYINRVPFLSTRGITADRSTQHILYMLVENMCSIIWRQRLWKTLKPIKILWCYF